MESGDEYGGINNYRGLLLVVSSPIFGGWEKGIETSVGNTWTVDIKSIVGGQDCRAKGPM